MVKIEKSVIFYEKCGIGKFVRVTLRKLKSIKNVKRLIIIEFYDLKIFQPNKKFLISIN